ncbi:MAG: hypothetical protein H3C31_05060 [Brumimicrobium sp.]|nr:hypothetical protein [Brumimicrobium sp.]MCO5269826.1 hypothetical protein [Brumimicrobium sp.]
MKALRLISIIFLIVFGGVTIFMSTSVVFDLFGIRAMEGNYVPFVVYANMVCGYMYIIAALLYLKRPLTTAKILLVCTSLLIITFSAFLIYIQNGGVHELKTIKAMTFRVVITALLTVVAFYIIKFSPDKD